MTPRMHLRFLPFIAFALPQEADSHKTNAVFALNSQSVETICSFFCFLRFLFVPIVKVFWVSAFGVLFNRLIIKTLRESTGNKLRRSFHVKSCISIAYEARNHQPKALNRQPKALNR